MKKEVKTTMANKAHEEIPGNPSVSTSSNQKLNDRSNGKPLRVLSEEDWRFWMHNGYIVIKNAIPKDQAKATADFIWEFDEKDPNDPSTWYAKPRAEMQMKELAGTGMVEAYNHQTLWNNRQMQKVYDAFVDVWGTEKLWVTIDRVNLNFPQRPGEEKEGFIHWDYDPETRPQNVQGVIALADQMDESMGGFQCIPWLYRNYDTWKLTQPEDRHRFQPNLDSLQDKLVKVLMEAGDLLIFNSTEPHGIRPNRSGKKVRIAQYISMMPAEEENQELKDWRINSWKNRVAPVGYAFPGDPRNWEQEKYKTAELSKLGKKLLGLENW
ncbi:phytanoyl-CoA dioxygenase family protein [Flavobacteriaceae bacterium]|jgi:ectoine hydroxylase-related dioxygenase (phytanoyl-CoA dioxygenase family)|nr:phytanoyl-CoA dioxygenase family protein [Flavobacteriaceae bacterium]MDA9368720.1 phytanoyl-CoA dioxygenase family protein [Flavobacteriaceae bacterium]MDB9714106.1 phytanoyl-CoA dioxygenase family protein [Flavobacteriaceae bacterium]MDC0120066.1 phytanoyl-CoA dioxygenase family protein [Flavobacteriaceae bacterium]MDC1393527.1 phytanoyl-CoA dioxygenase family protein [Flavobacteriaceae bacterium]